MVHLKRHNISRNPSKCTKPNTNRTEGEEFRASNLKVQKAVHLVFFNSCDKVQFVGV